MQQAAPFFPAKKSDPIAEVRGPKLAPRKCIFDQVAALEAAHGSQTLQPLLYTARDLAGHYDPDALLYACARCDGAEGPSNRHDVSETQWRRKMRNQSQQAQSCSKERCAMCGRKFGLVRYYSRRTALCSTKCVDQFQARCEGDHKWLWRFRAA